MEDDVGSIIKQVSELGSQGLWVPVVSLLIGLALRLSKSDVTWAFLARFNITPSVRPWVALGLGLVYGVLQAVVGGTKLVPALIGGVVSAIMAISTHQLIIESARGGREIGQPKDDAGSGGPPMGGKKSGRPLPGYSTPMVALVLGAAIALPGCAGWQKQVGPVLSDAEAYIADAQQVIDVVRVVSNLWFLGHADATAQAKVERAIGDASLAIDVAVRATRGLQEVTAEQLDAAWADFQRSYRELEFVLKDVGVVNAGRLGAGHGAVPIPEPIALHGKR